MIMPVSTPVIVLAFCVTRIVEDGKVRQNLSILSRDVPESVQTA
jgi:hypothetical protein